ncbi:MAG: NAD/NADP octopine/nopaline dehydrogenase family protein, partial [Muribaculaceae bacterium]|nr:NAD/NADP octopine/nopaline dehydrogenase family protein [Muribaculaceae bacterium]
MNKPLQICICGGGSQGHISTGVIGSKNDCVVRVLTRRPSLWSREFVTVDLDGNEYHANIEAISDNPSDVIPQSDIILICLPGYALREELKKIKPFVRPDAIVGCAFGGSGFFIDLFDVFGEDAKGFALQRVPYTGRVREYGHSASLKGYKPYLKVATHNIGNPEELVSILRNWYSTPVYLLRHWLEVTLSNSNPLLHPCRMSVMFKDWTPGKEYDHIPYMYNTDWDDESSQCWIDCDNELHVIMAKLPMDKNEVPTVLEYYGCDSVESLTAKMQSIVTFKTVQAHMNPTGR